MDESECADVDDINSEKFDVAVHDQNGNVKNFINEPGMQLWHIPDCIRVTVHKTFFSYIKMISEVEMAGVTWEIMKELLFCKINEEDFYDVSDLQFCVHRMNQVNIDLESLIIPSDVDVGFKSKRMGKALFFSRSMNEPTWGEYVIHHGKRIEFLQGWSSFCKMNNIDHGSVIVVKIEIRNKGALYCIGNSESTRLDM